MSPSRPLVSLTDVTAHYGPSQALFGVSLSVARGQVLALMGRNGMGKTTTLRTLCRMLPHSGGEVRLDGRSLAGMPSYKVARMGVGLVPEGRRCFAPLTVAENLLASARPGPWDKAAVTTLFPRLGERMQQRAGQLSGGEQQMLAIARALMTNPRLLVLDEATEGLAPLVRAEIWVAIAALKSSGLALIVVDKSLAELRAIADHGVVLSRGRSVWAGPMQDLTPALTDQHLGV